jgi:hypothetical protein
LASAIPVRVVNADTDESIHGWTSWLLQQRVVQLAPEGTAPVARIAKDLGISESCLKSGTPTPPRRDPSLDGNRLPLADAESGRGLFLVASLSERWSCYTMDQGGKVVWPEVVA